MVMTDPMHPLPFRIVDGESVVVYHSLQELKQKILYYLEHEEERRIVAKRGYDVAMNFHRSWHMLERMILGNWSAKD
jgi:spore maturation protein CgeB